jgi:predicted choloylglycine hydrolase
MDSCTIGVVKKNGRVFMLKNFDYWDVPVAFADFSLPKNNVESYKHFALVDHHQPGINSGMNECGLGLLISASGLPAFQGIEKRTWINARILSKCKSVKEAIDMFENYAYLERNLRGGNFMFADKDSMAVVEYFKGKTKHEYTEKDGWLVRANHSTLGVVDNLRESSQVRYVQMVDFISKLYDKMDDVNTSSDQQIITECKDLLLTPPIFNTGTLAHLVLDITNVDFYHSKRGCEWKIHKFE